MKGLSIEKIGFVVSLAVLAMLYGYGAKSFGWFPGEYVDRAGRQVQRVFSEPVYLYPRVHERSGTRTLAPNDVQPGLTLVSSRWEETGWNPSLRLIDREGNTLHEWYIDPSSFAVRLGSNPPLGARREADERPVHGVHLYPDGGVVFNLEYVGTARMDACSRVQWRIANGSHHSVATSDDGTFWIPGSSSEVRSATPAHPAGLPGLDSPVYMDRILHVTADGKVVDSLNVLDILYSNDLERHIFKSDASDSIDVTHLNDIKPLSATKSEDFPSFEAGDLLISLRNLDLVMVVDPDSRAVKWHESSPFIAQHDPDFMDGGWIGVFDNNRDETLRGTVLGGSRIVAIQPHTDSTRILFPTFRSDTFYTDIMGKWQRLENGNLLLTESRAGRVVEVAPDGRTVWEWIVEPYDEAMVPEVTKGTRYDLTEEEVASWPCSEGETG